MLEMIQQNFQELTYAYSNLFMFHSTLHGMDQ